LVPVEKRSGPEPLGQEPWGPEPSEPELSADRPVEAATGPWWGPSPDPDLPSIGAKRAYTEVLFVYLVFFLAGIMAAVLILANRSKDLPTNGSWGIYMVNAVNEIAQIGLAVAVVLLLGARRAVKPATLGLRLPRHPDGRLAVSQSIRISAWCFFAIIAGNLVNYALQTGHLPNNQANAPQLIFGVVEAVQAGVVEELVVLAFVVVSLRQAGRPWWEVTAVALVLRGAYHVYYGPGVFGILIWAALFFWLYVRFRQLLPLIVCHAVWDAVAFLSQATTAVVVAGELLVVGLWITAFILWLIERNDSGAGRVAQPAAVGVTGPPPETQWYGHPPAGWHPDPAGLNRWRWWDGHRWTEHVSPPS
jgi:hypothetical protein